MSDFVKIRGARQNNLKGVNLDIPKRTLTVVTGLSGSGKSSLVFDTIFAEGQRRYMESLSTYARQFLERLERPDYETIEGISPTIAIEQKNPVKTARSTVGTSTEIYDFLRLLYARVGDTICPECGRIVLPDTVSGVADDVLALGKGTKIFVTFPVKISRELTWNALSESLMSRGFMRILSDGKILRVDTGEKVEFGERGTLLVVVDRITVGPRMRTRLVDSLETALSEGEGELVISIPVEAVAKGDGTGQSSDSREQPLIDRLLSSGWSQERGFVGKRYTEKYRCPDCCIEFIKPTPLFFSFNNPFGACPACRGFGNKLVYDEDLIVPNPELTLRDGAVDPWTKPMYEWWWDDLLGECENEGIPTDVPFACLPEDDKKRIFYGDDSIDGVIPFLEGRERKKYKKHVRFFLRRYQSLRDCSECRGGRLRRDALNVRIAGKTIVEVNRMTIDEARRFFNGISFTPHKRKVSKLILKEIRSRLDFLYNVGVGYLTLDRLTRTLSGGEAQRINLASALGNQLIDAIYVLDEPTIGLHPRDTRRLIRIMTELRDQGNTLLVVEHDRDMMEAADHLIELGPRAGEHGGEVIYQGALRDLGMSDTATGRYLAGKDPIEVKRRRKPRAGYSIYLQGAKLHNLKNIDVEFPLGLLVLVTGVSGAGKSTLVHDVLYTSLAEVIAYGVEKKKDYLESIDGVGNISRVVLVDQSPIGKTPRSNPVSYVQALGPIREVFAKSALARKRRYRPGRFSFNVKGGRCEECKGEGFQKIEMHFMADVYVRCEECRGTRFKKETLDVTYRGRNIAEVLNMTVDEALRFFEGRDEVGRRLWYLSAVGLGYLRLGQSATTLSGGEAQRVKIARELGRIPQRARDGKARAGAGKARIPVFMADTGPVRKGTLYIMDEPTTGLHYQDIRKLLAVLDRLVESGNTVLVIEHNQEVVKHADWIIDLGPEGGEGGGSVVADGTPEQIAGTKGSYTGRWLARELRNDRKAKSVKTAAGGS